MIRVLFSLTLLAIVATACPGLADDQPSELKADAAYGVLHAEERVIDLPADQSKWHISVVGNVTGETGGLTPGAVYYLDPDTPGNLTQTAPTTTGDFVVRVGRAISATAMEISVSQPILL